MADYDPDPYGEGEEPVTSLAVSAVTVHEWFMSFVGAGFTRDEAIQLVIGLLNG